MVWSRPVFITLGLILVLTLVLRVFVVELLWVQTLRFEPTLKKGDLIVGLRQVQPERGDFVSHRCDSKASCISQVIGLEGDRVDFEGDQILINAKPFEWTVMWPKDAPLPEPQSWVVPPGSYFILGDESEVILGINISSVFNRILVSFDPGEMGIRWSRFAQRIR